MMHLKLADAMLQHGWTVFSAPLILLAYFASLPISSHGKSPFMYCAVLMAVLVCTQLFRQFVLPAYVCSYIRLMVLLLHCILDVVLFFVFGQDLNTSRDSPMHIPTEFMYAIPLIAGVFIMPSGFKIPQQTLSVSSFAVLCLILSSDTGTAHPYPIDAAVGITVFLLLSMVFAYPVHHAHYAVENTFAVCAKYAVGTVFIYAYVWRSGPTVDSTIVRDFHTLRNVTGDYTLSYVFIRLHFVLSTAAWFARFQELVKQNLSLAISTSSQYASDIHELFVACAVFIVTIAAFSVCKVKNCTYLTKIFFT